MLEFTPLASSSAGCAYRLSGGGASKPLLIDCGLPFKQLQRALDFKTARLAGCLISHAHGDHSRSYAELMKAGVTCYASKETWDMLPATAYDHNRETLLPCKVIIVNRWVILPFESVHDCPGTFGFLINAPRGEVLLYLTDTRYSRYKFTGLTHIAIEANHSMELLRKNAETGRIDPERFRRTANNHMAIERVIDFLKANDLSKVQEIHLLHLSDDNSDETAFKAAVERATGIPCRVAAR